MISHGRIALSAPLDAIKESHRHVTLRLAKPRPRPPEVAGVLRWEGGGEEWTAVHRGDSGDFDAAVAGWGARIVESRVPSLDEIFVAHVGIARVSPGGVKRALACARHRLGASPATSARAHRTRHLRARLRGRPAPLPRARTPAQAGSSEWHGRRTDRAPLNRVHVLPRGVQLRPGRRPGRTPVALSRPHVHAAGDDPSPRGLAHALRHAGRGEPVAAHGAFRPLVVGTRAAPRLAGAAGRGVPRLDAGADVDGVRPARAAHPGHRAVAGGARCRRHPGRPARSPRALAGRRAGAAASARVPRRLLRRGARAPWRGARLAGSVRPGLPDRGSAVASAGPLCFALPCSSVVRVAAAGPGAAGARRHPAAVRAGPALPRPRRAGRARLAHAPGRDGHPTPDGRLHGGDRGPARLRVGATPPA